MNSDLAWIMAALAALGVWLYVVHYSATIRAIRWRAADRDLAAAQFVYVRRMLQTMRTYELAKGLPEEPIPSTHEDPLGQLGRKQALARVDMAFSAIEQEYERTLASLPRD